MSKEPWLKVTLGTAKPASRGSTSEEQIAGGSSAANNSRCGRLAELFEPLLENDDELFLRMPPGEERLPPKGRPSQLDEDGLAWLQFGDNGGASVTKGNCGPHIEGTPVADA